MNDGTIIFSHQRCWWNSRGTWTKYGINCDFWSVSCTTRKR